MITWERTPRDFNSDLSGNSVVGQPINVTSQPYCYYTDHSIEASYISSSQSYGIGQYFWLLEMTRRNGPPPIGDKAREFKLDVFDVSVEGVTKRRHVVYERSGSPSNITQQSFVLVASEDLNIGDHFTLGSEIVLYPYNNNYSTLDDISGLTAEPRRGMYDFTVTEPNSNVVTSELEYRALLPWGFPPLQNDTLNLNTALGYSFVLDHAPVNWTLQGDITMRTEIHRLSSPAGLIKTIDHTGSGVVTGWNGRNEEGEVSAGSHELRMFGIGPVEGGNSYTGIARKNITVIDIDPCPPTEEEKRKREKCPVISGSTVNRKGQAVGSFAGPPTGWNTAVNSDQSLSRQSANAQKEPESLGFGWAMTNDEKLAVGSLPNTIVYTHSGGQMEVWTANAITFEPTFPQNQTKLERETGYSFLMTFQDKSQKKFFPLAHVNSGKIQWHKDRNGNTLYFHYDSGQLSAISDALTGTNEPDGRVYRYEYLGSTSQPSKVVMERRSGGALLSSRETTYSYYTNNDAALGEVEFHLSSTTDAEGETQSFLYYADFEDFRFGKLYRVLDARGNIAIEYDYYDDSDKRVKSETTYHDPGTGLMPEMRRTFGYGSDGSGNATMTITSSDLTGVSPLDRITTRTFDSDFNVVKLEETVDENTNVTVMHYDDPDNPYLVTKRIDPNLNVEEYTYNSRGKVLTHKDKEGNITTYRYQLDDEDMLEAIWFPEEILYVINPISNRIRFRGLYFNYDLKGNISSVDETDFEADHYLGLEFQLTGGGTTDRVYVTPLSQRTTTFKLRNGVDHPETDGRIWKIIDARWDGSPSTADDYATVFDYYSDGNLKSIKYPDGPSSHIGPKITYTYDDFDNVIMVSDQLGNEWKAVFDQKDRLIESEDARGEKQYFDFQDGFLSQVHTPPNLGPSGEQSKPLGDGRIGRTSTMTYDYQGRLADVDSDVSASNQQKRVEYGYTGFGELHTLGRLISGFPKVTSWSYDQLGRVVQMTDTLGRLSTRSYEPFCTEYDSTSARGVEMKQTFDNLCRPKLTLAGSKNIERFYNHRQLLTRIEQRRFLSYGQALFGSDNYGDYSDQVYEFEYDEFNRLEKVEYPDGKNIRYTYGAANEILSVRDSEDRITRYEYNNDLSLRKVILDRSSNPPSHHGKEVQYEYDLAGRVKKIIYSDGIQIHYDDGGSPLASGWNENGQLTHIRYLKTGGSGLQLLRSYQYEYDDSGNRVRTVESNGTLSQDVEWLYRYDWLDRLVQVKRGLGGATPVIQREYVFDESDNRIYLDDYINNQTFWYTYKTVGTGTDTKYSDELDEVFIATGTGKRVPTDLSDFSSFETFQSDADGNITSRTNSSGTTKYSWNAFNDLVSVRLDDGTKSVNFYGPDSIREEALKNDGERVNSFYSGLSTIDENSSVNGSTGYFMGHQLMGFERNGNSYWFLTDGLTSVRSLIDDNGNEVATFEHDEFGNELDVTGSISSPKTWIGGLGVHDDSDESRLLYMRRRHYDPSLGRFLNRDPIGFAGGLNLFSYGANNPVTFVDHTGLQPGFYPPGTGPYINEYTPEGDSYRFRDEGRSKLYRDLDYSNDALYWEDTQDVGGRPTNYSQMEGKNTYEPPKKGKLPKGCLSKVLKRLGPLGAAYGIGSALSNIANAEEQDRCSVAACEAVDAVIPIDLLRALFQPRHPHQRREFNHNPSFHNLDIPPRSVRPR